MFISRLKNTYKEINKHSLEKDSLELESRKLEYKREELKKEFPCISNFLGLDDIFSVKYSKEFFRFKNEDDTDISKDLIFMPVLSGLYDKDYDFETKIEKKTTISHISILSIMQRTPKTMSYAWK